MKSSLTILTDRRDGHAQARGARFPTARCSAHAGPFGPYAPDNAYNQWFSKGFETRFKAPPNYASYQMAQAILGVKLAWEKAQEKAGGKRPTNEQVGAALENMTFEGPGGTVRMAIGKGHQAIMETAYGTTSS
jgi:branched-chain amino acid transport system substrate-binding protein